MGMSSEMSPRYLTVNQSGQVTYILESNNISLAQVQLAGVPASEVFLIQEEGKSLSESPILVADVNAENLNLLGNNVIVLVSQPQEVMIVNSDVTADTSMVSEWQENSSGSATALVPVTHLMTSIVSANSEEEWSSVVVEEESPNSSSIEDARSWLQDSLITTAALTSLSSYVQSRSLTKDA